MKTVIYYFSATGNSLWVARKLAAGLDNASLQSIPLLEKQDKITTDASRIGLVFPIYFLGIPDIVCRFLQKLEIGNRAEVFAVVTRGFSPSGGAIRQLKSILRLHKISPNYGAYVTLTDNYLPNFEMPEEEEQIQVNARAAKKVEKIVNDLRVGKKLREKSLLGFIAPLYYWNFVRDLHNKDKQFIITADCNGCATCYRVCPVENIKMENDKPLFLHRCEQCYACVHLCPKMAILPGEKSRKRKRRYRHREIKLKELIYR